MLDVAIVRQELAEMELNGRQYQTSRLLTQKLYLGSMNCFHMGTEGNRKTYTTIWLWLDLCQSPLLLPEGGGEGGNFPCAESQIVACWKMGWETIVWRLASGDLIIKPSVLPAQPHESPSHHFR